jgi:uncharacterized protein
MKTKVSLALVIRPATFTSVSLVAGFLALAVGELAYQSDFGLLAAVTLLISWFVYLTLTPALAARLHIVTAWDEVAASFTGAPHRSIPLFAGLTRQQTKTVALVGTVEHYEAGSHVLQKGGNQVVIAVILSGDVMTAVPHSGNVVKIETLGRGDLIGQGGTFTETRLADVDARTPSTVLRFDKSSLAQIERDHPQIAAVMKRNTVAILAARFARFTASIGDVVTATPNRRRLTVKMTSSSANSRSDAADKRRATDSLDTSVDSVR